MRRAAIVAAVVGASLAGPGGAQAAAPTTCLGQSVRATAGSSLVLRLDCSVRSRGKTVRLARGTRGGAKRAVTTKPRHGRLTGFSSKRGVVRYRPRAGFTGTDRVGYRVRVGKRRLKASIRITVVGVKVKPKTPAGTSPAAPALTPSQANTTPDPGDGLPPRLPAAAGSVASTTRAWQPTAADTCSREVHDRYSVIGPDGKVYPTWHPPTTTDPATGKTCTFGHEHGRDPRGSDIYGWVAGHFAEPGLEAYSGVPFGQATEALDTWAAAHPGTPARQEDHVGYKIDFANDVPLKGTDGSDLGVTCDTLVRVHQGSHSADAISNNVHELLYATRCSDGTELISNTVARFGAPGSYSRGCDTSVSVSSTNNGYPSGEGSRAIPDRACIETNFLVPAGRTTSAWASYEKWSAKNTLEGSGAPALATFETAFGVFNPSRYANGAAAGGIARLIDLCWETEANGDRANGTECDEATAGGTIGSPYAYTDTRSPFNGTYRDFYIRDVTVQNTLGTSRVWTDPYGGNASTTPFPGAICQLVGPSTSRPAAQERVFGRNRRDPAPGVHAPN